VPHPIEWLSDNGPPYTANETRDFGESLGLIVCTTPAYSPESNGMAESFVKSFKRDYVYLNELHTAAIVMERLAVWFEPQRGASPQRLALAITQGVQKGNRQRLGGPVLQGQLHGWSTPRSKSRNVWR
jgi:transposase InsO family protein